MSQIPVSKSPSPEPPPSRLRTKPPQTSHHNADGLGFFLEILEEIKNISQKDHNITVTSAALSLPTWIDDRAKNLLIKACDQTNIEVFEPPRSRAEHAARTVKTGSETKSVLVLDHEDYYFSAHRVSWRESDSSFRLKASRTSKYIGGLRFRGQIAWRVISAYIPRYNKADGSRRRELAMQNMDVITRGSFEVQYALADLPMSERFVELDVTGPLQMNLTGRHVLMAEDSYMHEMRSYIQGVLAMQTPSRTLPLPSFSDKCHPEDSTHSGFSARLNAETTCDIIPPPILTHTIDSILILDNGPDEHLPRRTAEQVLAWNSGTQYENADMYTEDLCPSIWMFEKIAARAAVGAALGMRGWVGVYDELVGCGECK